MQQSTVHYATESVSCYQCNGDKSDFLLTGQDDLTGIPGNFSYVRCSNCGLVYQNPRLTIDEVKQFYTDQYVAHRKENNWGILTPLYNWAMEKHDREKMKILYRHTHPDNHTSILDVGCAVGTFLLMAQKRHQCSVSGVDFKDMTYAPGFDKINFHHGLFHQQKISPEQFNIITMWHFLEHDYHPVQSLRTAHNCLKNNGLLFIEVPRLDSTTFSLYGSRWPGVQAPQHTILFDRNHFIAMVENEGFSVVEYLPWGAFPAYFYLFTGMAFLFLKGRGLNLKKAIAPYFIGQLLMTPVLLFERQLNLCMQTVILKKSV